MLSVAGKLNGRVLIKRIEIGIIIICNDILPSSRRSGPGKLYYKPQKKL